MAERLQDMSSMIMGVKGTGPKADPYADLFLALESKFEGGLQLSLGSSSSSSPLASPQIQFDPSGFGFGFAVGCGTALSVPDTTNGARTAVVPVGVSRPAGVGAAAVAAAAAAPASATENTGRGRKGKGKGKAKGGQEQAQTPAAPTEAKKIGRPPRDLQAACDLAQSSFVNSEPASAKYWGAEAPAFVRNTKNLIKDVVARLGGMTKGSNEYVTLERSRKAVEAIKNVVETALSAG
jgi:hypothetical protein